MDVALFAVSGSLAVYLPRQVFGYQSRNEQLSMAVAIGLSLILFSLSILEAAPNSWLIIVSLDESFGVRISFLYWLILWMLSAVILVIFPCLAGMTLAQSFGDLFRRGSDERNYRAWKKTWMACPWWVRLLGGLVFLITQYIWKFFVMIFSYGRRKNLDVVMTKSYSDDELRLSSSADLEFQTLVQPSNQGDSITRRILGFMGSLAGVSIVILLSRLVAPFVIFIDSDKGYLPVLVSYLCAVGLVISSLLNGFGSVSFPYTCLAGLYVKPVRPEVFTRIEAELQSVRDAAATKRAELRETKVTIDAGSTGYKTKTSVLSNFTSKVQSFSSLGEGLQNRRQVLQNEVDFLDSLAKDMKDELDDLRVWQIKATKARTTEGRIRSGVGLVFSLVLLVRMGSIALHIGQGYLSDERSRHHGTQQNDMITSALLWLTGHDLVSKREYGMISQGVSLGLTAVLSFTQVRKFLHVVGVVNRKWQILYHKCYCVPSATPSTQSKDERSRFGTVAEGVFSQVFAGASGCYFLSCIVLIKMMLPEEFCEGFSNALGGREVFSIHQAFVNRVFAWSACASLFVLAMIFGIQKQNNFRHATAVSETQKVTVSENV